MACTDNVKTLQKLTGQQKYLSLADPISSLLF